MAKEKDFLDAGYEIPTKENYMKFQQGENRFRILSPAILGWEWWIDAEDGKRKPIRATMQEDLPVEFADEMKHFWAMVVWNYSAERVQILEITQKSLQRKLKALVTNKKWGKPYAYDMVVTRQGEGLETVYDMNPDPKEILPPEIKNAYKEDDIDLKALYKGDDPFKKEEKLSEDFGK